MPWSRIAPSLSSSRSTTSVSSLVMRPHTRRWYTRTSSRSGPRLGSAYAARRPVLNIARNYPGGPPQINLGRITGEGDHWVVEARSRYPDGTDYNMVAVLELRGGIDRPGDGLLRAAYPAPDRRRQWVERIDDRSLAGVDDGWEWWSRTGGQRPSARSPPDGDLDVPVHGHRGLDATRRVDAGTVAFAPGATSEPSSAARSARTRNRRLTEGDGFFAVFSSAAAGVAAAVQAQRALAAEAWPSEAPIRVRIGLHSGEAVLDSDGSYIGHDVHRAARLGNAGDGGQNLPLGEYERRWWHSHCRPAPRWRTSASTASKGPATSSHQPGRHRRPVVGLRALSIAERAPEQPACPGHVVHRSEARACKRRRPARADEAPDPQWPGRHGTAPAGTARRRSDVGGPLSRRCWFVALEPLRTHSSCLPTVAHTSASSRDPDNRPSTPIAGSVGDRRVLLVLDNLEQVIEAAGDVATLLRACAGITVVVTSRAVLRIAGEQEYLVPGLPAPPDTAALSRLELDRLPESLRRLDPATLDQYEAVRLFIARAQAALPAFGVTTQNAPAIAGSRHGYRACRRRSSWRQRASSSSAQSRSSVASNGSSAS